MCLVAYGNSGTARTVDGCLKIRAAVNIIDKFLYPSAPPCHRHIMGGKTAPDSQLWGDILKVIGIPVLVCVAENKVERSFQIFDQIMRIGEPGVYILG